MLDPRQAGLSTQLTIHSLRVGFATSLYQAFGDLTLMSSALGHQDPRPVLRCVQPSWRELVRAVEACFREELLQGEPA